MAYDIILASASPRRTELLTQMGVSYRVIPADVDETVDQPLSPAEMVRELAFRKASAISALYPSALVIGADTLVAYGEHILGKPNSSEHAFEMLSLLNGKCHDVYTGVALICSAGNINITSSECSQVCFRQVDQQLLRRYIATGEPMDKAGAYAIQGHGAVLVEKVVGCYNNVVGLPTALLSGYLEKLGVELLLSV